MPTHMRIWRVRYVNLEKATFHEQDVTVDTINRLKSSEKYQILNIQYLKTVSFVH